MADDSREAASGAGIPMMESGVPYVPSADLAAKLQALGLDQNAQDMKEQGYTVIHDVGTSDLASRIRAAIIRAVEADPDNDGRVRATRSLLLGLDPVFSEAVTDPKILAITELAVGRGALISQVGGSVTSKGQDPLHLHSDQNWTPAPFPDHTQLVTFCWVTDEFTLEGGATKVVPGSHRHRRQPNAEEISAAEGAVPILGPKGSVAVWRGETWHGAYPRQLDGQRVVLHTTYSRLALRPIEDFSYLDDEWLKDQPREMRTLLGKDDFLSKPNTARHDPEFRRLLRQTFEAARS